MLTEFFLHLRHSGVKVTITEWLDLLHLMAGQSDLCLIDDFYALSRLCLVKDEAQYDRFDQAFGNFFEGIRQLPDPIETMVPEEWLQAYRSLNLSDDEKAAIQKLGGLEELLATLKKRLEEQKKKHQGGSKWIGTGGTSPFGHSGYHPEGIRVGGSSKQQRAVKVWEKRQFKNLDDQAELGTRNIKLALRVLRQFARTGSVMELDMDDTIRSTAKNAGMLDVKMRAERHNAVKVLLLLDVGGSMDYHVRDSEQLFTACRAEFKHLDYYYFHNFIYDQLWPDNQLRYKQTTALNDIINTYGADYKVILVGDASMSPYEIAAPFGSIDFMNERPGSEYFRQLIGHFNKVVWLNPVPENQWQYVQSINMVRRLINNRMFPLTLEGITGAVRAL